MLPEKMVLQCSSIELYTMASLIGGEMLVGVADPFRGWLTEEIELSMRKARQKLIKRKLLTGHGVNGLIMDVFAAALINTMISPQAVLLLTTTEIDKKDGKTANSNNMSFYSRLPLLIMIEENKEGYCIQSIDSPGFIREKIAQTWKLTERKVPQSTTFFMPERVIDLANQMHGLSEQVCLQRLQKTGLSSDQAKPFARILPSAQRNGALVAMRPGGSNWEIEGVGMLECEKGFWMLRSVPRNNAFDVEFIPASGTNIQKEIDLLLTRFFPISKDE
jgi:hypothetical protein